MQRRVFRSVPAPKAGRAKLRVLHVVFSNPTTGLMVVVGELVRAQVRAGNVEPFVLAAGNEAASSLLGLDQVPAVRFDAPQAGLWRFLAHARACHQLDPAREGFDLVHAHGQHAICLLAGFRRFHVGSWAEVGLVYSCHGWQEDTCPRRAGVRLELRCYRFADAVFACSPHQVSRLERQGLCTPVHHVMNGIKPPASPLGDAPSVRARIQVPPDAELVGNVGRLSSEKRQDVFLRACRIIAAHSPSTYFVIVGGGRERARLEALARSLHIADRVRFTGFIDDAQVVLSGLTLLLHTSDHEAAPIAVIEAMALDVPVVATRVGGLPALLGEDRGRLAPPGDVAALARYALELLSHPAERAAMAQRARAHFSSELTIDVMRQRTEQAYLAVLGGLGGCRPLPTAYRDQARNGSA